MFCQIAENADGHLCLRGIDGHAAAVGVVHRDDVIHIGIFGEKFFLHLFHSHVQHAGHALNGSADSQNISGSGRTSPGIAVSLPGLHRRFRQVRHDVGAVLHIVHVGRHGEFQHMLVDPASFLDIVDGIAQHHSVADNRAALRNVFQGDLMGLGDILGRHNAFHHFCPRLDLVDSDGHIVLIFNFDVQWSAHVSSFPNDTFFFIPSWPENAFSSRLILLYSQRFYK